MISATLQRASDYFPTIKVEYGHEEDPVRLTFNDVVGWCYGFFDDALTVDINADKVSYKQVRQDIEAALVMEVKE